MRQEHRTHRPANPTLSGSGRNPFQASDAQPRSDAEIREEIYKRLRDDPLVDPTGIFVSVSSGRVLLEGSVENDEAKRRAETCSRQVSGISGHDSNLNIRKSR